MPQFGELRGTLTHQAYLPSQATAGTDDNWPVFIAPANLTVTAVKFTPSANITADGTNFTTLTLQNKGTGSGSTTVASRAWSATNSVVSTPESFTLSGTAANLNAAAGDSLEVVKTHGGTGLTIPDGCLTIYYKLR
jgi:hypothetical protein